MTALMNDEDMQAVMAGLQSDGTDDVTLLDAAISQHPDDPRLHFLKASSCAGEGRLIEAHASFAKAVEIAPDFHIARFQFGFFQLTSGESDNALKTWARLDALPKDHYLRVFVIGLRHLIRDEFSECIDTLERGIALNEENPPLNNDMGLIIEQVKPLMSADAEASMAGSESEETEEASLTSILLQHSNNQTRH